VHCFPVRNLEVIESEIRSLSRADAERLQDWLSDYLEQNLQVTPEFAASIDRGKADLAAGESRVRETSSGDGAE